MTRLNELDTNVKYDLAERIGIDENHIAHDARFVVCDTSQQPAKLIDMGVDRKKNTVRQILTRFAYPEKIKTVSIDMTRTYEAIASEVFENARIVIDRFHVSRYIQESTEFVRKGLWARVDEEMKYLSLAGKRQRMTYIRRFNKNAYLFKKGRNKFTRSQIDELMTILKEFPEFGKLWELKESFFDFYEYSVDVADAKAKFEAWVDSIPDDSLYDVFRENVKMIRRWEKSIFNYFVDPIDERIKRPSNGPTEAINGTIKRIVGEGYGYGFEVMRGKVVYAKTHIDRKTTSRPFVKQATEHIQQFILADNILSNAELSVVYEVAYKSLIYIKSATDFDSEAATSEPTESEIEYFVRSLRYNNNMQGTACMVAEKMDEGMWTSEAPNECLIKTPVTLDELERDELIYRAICEADSRVEYS